MNHRIRQITRVRETRLPRERVTRIPQTKEIRLPREREQTLQTPLYRLILRSLPKENPRRRQSRSPLRNRTRL